MSTVDLFALLIPASLLVLFVAEALWPAIPEPTTWGWRLVGLGNFGVMTAIGTFLPLLVPDHVWASLGLLDLSGLGPVGGFLVGWFVYSAAGYGWHRLVHASPLAWRLFHQLHHAPRRLDVASSTLFHPTEIAAYTLLTVGTSMTLGLSPEAAAVLGFFASFVSFFQHANMKTPTWLGYFVQRPEAHRAHHAPEAPLGNYSDFPLWDLCFGTFFNPKNHAGPVGFAPEAAARWPAMLAFVDAQAIGDSPMASAVPVPSAPQDG